MHAHGVAGDGVFRQRFVRDVVAVRVGHDVGHAGRGGRLHELGVRVARGAHRERDDQELLVVERGGQGGGVVVVNGDGVDAGG